MRVAVGRIGRAHGVRGAVVVGVRTDEPELRFAAGSKLDTDPAAVGPLTISATRWSNGELLVRFVGVRDRDAAEALAGTWLTVDSETLEPLDDADEFRDSDLIGLAVRTVPGAAGVGSAADPGEVHVGEVTDVLHHGQDLLVVRPAEPASPDILIPFVKQIVPDVDLASGVLFIDPPDGLLNANTP